MILLFIAIIFFLILISSGFYAAIAFLACALIFRQFLKHKAESLEKEYGISHNEDEVLSCPDTDYSYYNIVGMKYRNLSYSDIGIHKIAIAVAETDNPYDKYAVGIYRNDTEKKLIGYIPRTDNKYLHQYLTNKVYGTTDASYKIWIDNDGNYKGFVFIRDDKFYQK